jgi:hypothetical protein
MSLIALPFIDYPYPTKKPARQFCSWGSCGLFAHVINDIVTVYGEDSGRFSPILIMSPAESTISAIAWYDSNCTLSLSLPVLVVATVSGRLSVHDIRMNKVIASLPRRAAGDCFTRLVWSSFSDATIFGATSTGAFVKIRIQLGALAGICIVWELHLPFEIDFFCLEPLGGETVAAVSSRGPVGIIGDVHTDVPVRRCELSLGSKGEKLVHVSFFPAAPENLIVVTTKESFVYSLREFVAVSFISVPKMLFIAFTANKGNRAVIVKPTCVELWDVGLTQCRLTSELALGAQRFYSVPEISLFDFRNDALIIVTASWWLTVITIRRNRLFVSSRVRLMNAKPLDWSFTPDQVAFATRDGQVLVTGRQKHIAKRRVAVPVAAPAPAKIPRSSSAPSIHPDPGKFLTNKRTDPLLGMMRRTLCSVRSRVPLPEAGQNSTPNRLRRRSMHRQSARMDLIQIIANKSAESVKCNEASRAPKPEQTEFGCSCGLCYAFRVCEEPLQHVEWVGINRLVAWSNDQERLYLIDMGARRVVQLFGKLRGVPIMNIVFSPDREKMCILLKFASSLMTLFFTTGSRPQMLGSRMFEGLVSVDFTGASDRAFVVTAKAAVFTVIGFHNASLRFQGPYRLPYTLKHHDRLQSLSIRKHFMYFGTLSGSFLRLNTATTPWAVSEVRQFRFPIDTIQPGPPPSLLVLDERGNGQFLSTDGEWSAMPGPVKHAVMCCPFAFLARVPGQGKLSVVPVIGTYHPPFPVTAKSCPILFSAEKFRERLQSQPATPATCLKFGMPLICRALLGNDYPNWAREQLLVLRNLFIQADRLFKPAIRYCLIIGDFQTARQLALDTPASDPLFRTNMIKAVVIGTQEGHKSLEEVVQRLFDSGFRDEAIDLCLLTGRWDMAVTHLLKMNYVMEAAFICRAQEHDNPQKRNFAQRIARHFITDGAFAYAVTLLAECADFESIEELFDEHSQMVQADFIRDLVSRDNNDHDG